MYWLGIDIGTGGSRALLVDEKGLVKASYTALHEDMRMERPLWAEQRPENWWDAAQEAIRGVLHEADVSAEAVKGVGLSGQMHGLTLLDEKDKVIRPALTGAGVTMTVGDLAFLPVEADPDSPGKTGCWWRAQPASANAPATPIKFQRMAFM